MHLPERFIDQLLDLMGYQEGAESTADGASNDLATERADAVVEFMRRAEHHSLPNKLLESESTEARHEKQVGNLRHAIGDLRRENRELREQLRGPNGADATSLVTVYASIGNSDDKLPQAIWRSYLRAFRLLMRRYSETVYGDWVSETSSAYQNACMCIQVRAVDLDELRSDLLRTRVAYGQDSIAFSVLPAVEML